MRSEWSYPEMWKDLLLGALVLVVVLVCVIVYQSSVGSLASR